MSLGEGPGNEATTCLWIHCQSRDDELERRRNARDVKLYVAAKLGAAYALEATKCACDLHHCQAQGEEEKGKYHRERENNTAAYIAMHRKSCMVPCPWQCSKVIIVTQLYCCI